MFLLMRLCRSQPFRDTEFYTHDYLLLSPYIFYMPPYKLFSTARSYSLSMIKFFYTTRDILPIQFHTRISNFMFQKSTPTLIFLRFTFMHIQVFFYSQAYQIQHYFHKHKLCQQHEAITLSYFTNMVLITYI
jgi:hypothetical protein